ncbi:TRAP transporter substrate-binding protein [candidate division WOR-3 bacterium]|nr:TRAP transporter substrate-binding protein [candidate division WOR-3 bacterium]
MKLFRNAFIIIFIVVTLIISAGCGGKGKAAEGEINLKLGHALDINHPVHKAMKFWADTLKGATDGRIIIKIYPGGQLGGEKELIEQLQMGTLDLTKVSSAGLEAFVPEMKVLGMPYLFRNKEHKWKVLNSAFGKDLLAAGSDRGLVGIGFYEAGERSFYTKDRLITTPADLKNLKIRVIKSPMAIDLLKTLGASPTPISWGELYTALQQGTVDGAENNPPSFVSARHYEVCKYYSLDKHTSPMDVVLAGTKAWDKLTEADRAIMIKTFDISVEYQKELWAEVVKENFALLDSVGVKVITPDQTPFVEAVQPMYKEYATDEIIGPLLEKVKAIKEE